MTDEILTQRFFVKDGQALAVIERRANMLTIVTNQHVLTDPDDLTSVPHAGWEEIDERSFRGCARTTYDKVESDKRAAATEQTKALKEAYEEAIQLGFSERAARTMSGYSGA